MPILPPPLIHHAQEETRSTAQYSTSTQGNVDHHARRNACVIRTLLLARLYGGEWRVHLDGATRSPFCAFPDISSVEIDKTNHAVPTNAAYG